MDHASKGLHVEKQNVVKPRGNLRDKRAEAVLQLQARASDLWLEPLRGQLKDLLEAALKPSLSKRQFETVMFEARQLVRDFNSGAGGKRVIRLADYL